MNRLFINGFSKMKILCLLVLNMHGIFGYAQDLKSELKQVYQKFNQSSSIIYDIRVSNYTSKDAAPEIQLFHFEQNGNQYYYNNDLLEMYVDKQVSLMVYKDKKVILWSKTDPEQMPKNAGQQIINMDSVFTVLDSIKYQGESQGLKHYSIYSSSSYIMQTDVSIDPKTNQFIEITYYYEPNTLLGNYKCITHFDKLVISKESIPVSKNRKMFLTGEIPSLNIGSLYRGYELIYVDGEKLY